MSRIRVLLIEDHQVVREGLRALLANEPDLDLVGDAADGETGALLAARLAPDVVVMDVSLPGASGIEAARRIRKDRPDQIVVFLSMHDDAGTVDAALRAGARGYVLKGRGVGALTEAIRTAARGEVYLSPEVSSFVLQGYLHKGQGEGTDPLSPREREILQLIAEGHTGREIAGRLGLKPKTVDNHRANIMDKLGIHTTAGLVRYALKVGLAR